MEIKCDRFEKLFSTPVLRYHVADHAALNAALLREASEMRLETGSAGKSNRGGWHSEGNLFERGAAAIDTLRAQVEAALRDANAAINSRAAPDSLRLKLFGWMNASPQGAYNAPHSHPGAHWSGVYYVNQPEVETGTSGMIEFIDARSDLPNWRILDAPAFRLKKRMRPAAGEMVLFPSYLVHWVYPNEAEDERLSIAFNATYKRKRSAP